MEIPSNIYADSVFSEHPISLYPLDDDVSYLSLISNDQRLFSQGGWTASANNSASVVFSDSPSLPEVNSPFSSHIYTSFLGSGVSSDNTTLALRSPKLFDFDELNQDLKTFSISLYLYQNSTKINWYEVGYVYFDNFLSSDKEVVTRIEATEGSQWINFDFTYNSISFEDTNVRLIIKANVDSGGDESDYNFIVNGFCVGQWSENNSSQSLGVFSQSSSVFINEDELFGIPAIEYGVQEDSGYYLVENNRLLARNVGVPLVYGSENNTRIYPSKNNLPSIIVPGKGFLFDSGKFGEYSLEFWIRINPDTVESRRIFGPIDTDNGLYVRDGVISLLLGNEIRSHPVSEWYRPMLVHIILKESSAALYLNGEQVFTMPFDKNEVSFSSNNDWLGFYSYEDILNFEIDCISLYPYILPVQVAKKRFVWGQGTDSPQTVADFFDGKNVYINFSNANYTTNKTYPDTGRWGAGYSNNLVSTNRSISSPNYSLPEIVIENRNLQDLYDDNKIVCELEDEIFFTFRPNQEDGKYTPNGLNWTESGYLFFDSLNIVENLNSFYAIFSTEDIVENSPLIVLTNSTNSDTLKIFLQDGFLLYSFNEDVIFSEILDESGPEGYGSYASYGPSQSKNSFAVGLDIKKFSKKHSYKVSEFFKSLGNVQMYVGGYLGETFSGKIFSVGFSNKSNMEEIKSLFLDNGVADRFEYQDLLNHTATYTLTPLIRYNRFFLDISISSSWEEYFPLSSFASFIKNSKGKKYYDLDYLQLNLGYPSVTERVERVIQNTGWTYQELFNFFNNPIQKSYEVLDNEIFSGYSSYNDLNNNNIVEYFLDTSKSSLRAFFTFQLLSEGANQPIKNFPHSKDLIDCCFVDAELENTNNDPFKAYLTKFEFADNVVVFPPKNIDFKKVAIVVHFEIKQEGILSNPIRVRDFEIASRSLSQYSFNPIGTENAIPMYPYVKTGIYFDNKEKNPVLISKKRLPYLHLNQTSGIKVMGRQTFAKEYGVAIPINQEKNINFSMGSIQLWMKHDLPEFSVVPYPIFEIDSAGKTVEFVLRSDASGKRGLILARNKKTKMLDNSIVFYQNGIRVKSPIVEFNTWESLGISFAEPLVFDNFVGYFNIFRGSTFNNVSFFNLSGLGETSGILARKWLRVLVEDEDPVPDNFDWQYWYDENGLSLIKQWSGVYVLGETRSSVITPQDIYKTFVGTNRIIVDDGEELSFESEEITLYASSTTIQSGSIVKDSDISWSRFSDIPA
jgi:hypothetical protein